MLKKNTELYTKIRIYPSFKIYVAYTWSLPFLGSEH